MERNGTPAHDAVVIPLDRERAGTPLVPRQRTAPGSGSGGLDPLADLPPHLAAAVHGADSPEPFLAGFAHALWMSAAFVGLVAALLMATGVIG